MEQITENTETSIVNSLSKDVYTSLQLSIEEANKIIGSVTDLIPDPSYRQWHFANLYRLGANKYLDLAVTARTKGKTPPRLFVALLKSA